MAFAEDVERCLRRDRRQFCPPTAMNLQVFLPYFEI